MPSVPTICASCGRLLRDGACASCGTAPAIRGASLGHDDTAAAIALDATAPARPSSRTAPRERELTAGDVLGRRYRILRALGKGGMGEVVLATDLELDQPVALKFLPAELRDDPGHLARLRDEVKLARKVSHPNVCRVHDLAEADGRWFLTMEYVDGEDLGALLRRIGRLPPEKAIELAHQLCSGLHAAHEQGILHRDLKPANVMIDGEGRLEITDFGLAALAHEIGGAQVREGTPAYMAPEQLAGHAVTRKSDIYALGLVLYELFTGKRAHGAERRLDTRPAAPSTLLEGFDPATERVIMRCLEPDPEDRPASVLAVAAGLPGGDPIGAALAAGELPSPEMVAASGETGTLRPIVALVLLALVIVPMLVFGAAFERSSVIGRLPTPHPPEVLAHRAHEIADALGVVPEGDVAYWLSVENAALVDLGERHESEGPGVFDDPPVHPLRLSWRADPEALYPREPLVSVDDPPFRTPGAVIVVVDARGRLLELRRRPAQLDRELEAGDADAAFAGLLAHTGLDLERLEATAPALVPREYADERRAWTGAWSDGTTARVEAASLRGVPVSFVVLPPWDERRIAVESEAPAQEQGAGVQVVRGARSRRVEGLEAMLVLGLVVGAAVLAVGGLLLAIRSVRRGEGDRRTAARVALFVTTTTFVALALGSHLTGAELLVTPLRHLPDALLDGAVLWLAYIALEPYARRLWPHALVSWSRFVRGRWRDPLVGRDILMGTASVTFMLALAAVLAEPSRLDSGTELSALLGGRYAIATVVGLAKRGLWIACLAFVAALVGRLVLRRQWATVTLTIAAPAAVLTIADPTWANAVVSLAFGVSLAIALFRAGLLGVIAWGTGLMAFDAFPWTLSASAWYAGYGSLAALVVGGLAVASFWTALGGRPLLGAGFFGEPPGTSTTRRRPLD